MNVLMRLQELVVDLLGRWPATHKLLLVRGVNRCAGWLWRRRAYGTFERSARVIPAYRRFLAEHGASTTLDRKDRAAAFAALPIMDKAGYINRYPIADRCLHGRLPRRGVVVDDSCGSSGRPTSRVPGPVERRASRELLRVGVRAQRGRPGAPAVRDQRLSPSARGPPG